MTTTAVTYDRQELILPSADAEQASCHVFGVGTVGSNGAVELARLGIGKLHLYDYDVIEAHNLPSQRYFRAQVGVKKVVACTAQIKAVANDDVIIHAIDEKITEPMIVDGPLICAVDSMEGRRHIFTNIAKNSFSCGLFIDVRMSGNTLQIYSLDPQNKELCEYYEATLFDDKDADPAPCGGRTVSYTGAISGGLIATYVRKHLVGGTTPFFWSFDLDAIDASPAARA